MIKLRELRETPSEGRHILKDNPDLLGVGSDCLSRYIPPRRATTIESIAQEKDLSE